MAINSNSTPVGSFVATTNIWDASQLRDINVNSPEFKELLVRMYQNLSLMSTALNTKDTGYYGLNPFVTGQLFFPNPNNSSQVSPYRSPVFRQSLRQVVNFGPLPNTGTIQIPHGIAVNAATIWTRIYGAATDQIALTGIPLPFASPTLVNNISLSVDDDYVIITTGSNRSNYTETVVILEYLTN